MTWEGNLTRCPDPVAAKDAWLYGAAGTAGWRTQFSRDVALEFAATASVESCPKFDGLDRVSAGVQGSVRRKFGLGPFAPVLTADLTGTGSSYRESPRNATRLAAGLSLSQRWTGDWQTVVSAEILQNYGRLAAYDYHNHSLALETHYDLTGRWRLSAGACRQWGEHVVYAWLGGSGASFPYAYATWKGTVKVPTYGPNGHAYTMDAHADSIWFAVAPALGGDRALPLRFEQTAVVGLGESFRVQLISLSFVQRF